MRLDPPRSFCYEEERLEIAKAGPGLGLKANKHIAFR
jgi:hypothetical protein